MKHHRKQTSTDPRIGEVVLLKDNLPQGKWKIGKIIELIKGKDEAFRAAKVLVSPNKVFQRALNLLHLAENETTGSQDLGDLVDRDETIHDSSKGESQPDKLSRRATRQASVVAKQKLKRWLNPTDDFAALGSVVIPITTSSLFKCDDVR